MWSTFFREYYGRLNDRRIIFYNTLRGYDSDATILCEGLRDLRFPVEARDLHNAIVKTKTVAECRQIIFSTIDAELFRAIADLDVLWLEANHRIVTSLQFSPHSRFRFVQELFSTCLKVSSNDWNCLRRQNAVFADLFLDLIPTTSFSSEEIETLLFRARTNLESFELLLDHIPNDTLIKMFSTLNNYHNDDFNKLTRFFSIESLPCIYSQYMKREEETDRCTQTTNDSLWNTFRLELATAIVKQIMHKTNHEINRLLNKKANPTTILFIIDYTNERIHSILRLINKTNPETRLEIYTKVVVALSRLFSYTNQHDRLVIRNHINTIFCNLIMHETKQETILTLIRNTSTYILPTIKEMTVILKGRPLNQEQIETQQFLFTQLEFLQTHRTTPTPHLAPNEVELQHALAKSLLSSHISTDDVNLQLALEESLSSNTPPVGRSQLRGNGKVPLRRLQNMELAASNGKWETVLKMLDLIQDAENKRVFTSLNKIFHKAMNTEQPNGQQVMEALLVKCGALLFPEQLNPESIFISRLQRAIQESHWSLVGAFLGAIPDRLIPSFQLDLLIERMQEKGAPQNLIERATLRLSTVEDEEEDIDGIGDGSTTDAKISDQTENDDWGDI